MGIPFETFEELGEPTTEFPSIDNLPTLPPQAVEQFIDQVYNERSDLIAARYRRDGALAFKKAAYNGTRPELNLQLSAGYTALEEGSVARDYFSALTRDSEGPDLRAQIVYRFPVQNNEAEGVYAQALAAYRRQVVQFQEMQRTAKAEIAVSVANLRGNITAYRQAVKATELFKVALQNELKKFRAGLGSILDIQQVEEQLTESLLQEVQTRFSYAVALIDLRLASDMMYERAEEKAAVSAELLTTIPKELGLRGK